MRALLPLILIASAWPALADVLMPVRTIRAQAIVTAADFKIERINMNDAWPTDVPIDGLEARVALYPGRPLRSGDLGPPALVDRNQIVTVVYMQGPLKIAVEGRALSRGGIGDMVRVMNLDSRTTVTGRVLENGTVEVR